MSWRSRAVLEAAFPDGMPMPDSIDGELDAPVTVTRSDEIGDL